MNPHDVLRPQPEPTGDGPSVTDYAVAKTVRMWIQALLLARRDQGIARYGTELRAHNGRRVNADIVQELVDGLLYLRQAELEGCPLAGAQALVVEALIMGRIDER